MKTHEITTSKGEFVVVDVDTNWTFGLSINYFGKDMFEAINVENVDCSFRYIKCFKLSEATEEDAKGVVDVNRIVGGKIAYKDYLSFRFLYTALEYLQSLVKSKGIDINNGNWYLFKKI